MAAAPKIETDWALAYIDRASYHLFGGTPHPAWAKHVSELPGGLCAMMIGLTEPTKGKKSAQAVIRQPDGTRVIEVHSLEDSCGPECYSWKLFYELHLDDPQIVLTKFGYRVEDDAQHRLPLHQLPVEYSPIANLLHCFAYSGCAYDVWRVAEAITRSGSSPQFPPDDFGLRRHFLADDRHKHTLRHTAAQQYVAQVRETFPQIM